jgi:transcriptional regulator with XRE-family HTH domain
MPRGRKPANVDSVFNLKKLREFRHRAGLSLKDVEEATGILASNLSALELGHLVLQFHKIQELILLYQLDVFEVLELLRLRLIDPKLLRAFHRACKRHGTTPVEALNDFMIVFSREDLT